jgi:hypothetical protein
MTLLLLALAALLLWLGVDILRLSSQSAPLPRVETDKMMFGDPPPELSDAARHYAQSHILVRGGASTRVLGYVFLLGAAFSFALAVGWV